MAEAVIDGTVANISVVGRGGGGERVLVVDDDPDINRLLRLRLQARGYPVETASSGDEALARVAETSPDLIFLDVSMPGMSGLDVLGQLRTQGHDLAVIMTTAFGSEQVAIEALRRGADDYLRKPFEPSEFQAVLQRTVSRLRLSRQNTELRRQLDEKRRQLEAELARAGEVQAGLIPSAPPPLSGFEVAARCVPAEDVGGDFYDWQRLPDGTLDLTLGDVMGKGMPAALLMATVRAAVRAVALYHRPAEAIAAVESALGVDLERSGNFVTLMHARLDPARSQLAVVDAGHGHLFVRRASGKVEALGPRGLPLGVLPGTVREEGAVEMGPGDAFVAYSDGLVEARPEADLGPASLADLLAGATDAAAMVERLAAAAGPTEVLADDLTLLVLRRQVEAT